MIRIIVVIVALVPLAAGAQPGPPNPAPAPPSGDTFAKRFDELAEGERTELPKLPFKGTTASDIARSTPAFRNLAVETPGIDTTTGMTAAERAAAVVSTTVEGAEAGVILSPFALARSETLHGLSLTFAAFDDGVTRFGAGYVFETRKDPTIGDLQLACELDKDDLEEALRDTREAFVTTCSRIVAGLDPAALQCDQEKTPDKVLGCKKAMNAGFTACGLGQPFGDAPVTPMRALSGAKGAIKGLVGRATEHGFTIPIEMRDAYQVLRDYKAPRPLDCIKDKAVDAAVTKWLWGQKTHKISVSAFLDMYQLVLGHNPEMLEDFEAKSKQARVDYVFTYRGLEIGGGFAADVSREGRGKGKVGTLRPAFRVSNVVGSFDDEPLEKDGELRTTKDGKMPPIVIVGIEGEFGFATDPPDDDDASLRDLMVTVHLDFRYSETLAFRLGAPIQMKRVAAMNDATNIGRQWTLPILVATMIKL